MVKGGGCYRFPRCGTRKNCPDGSEQAAICYVLSAEKNDQGSNADYAKKLYQLAKALHFPDDYLAEIQLASGWTSNSRRAHPKPL